MPKNREKLQNANPKPIHEGHRQRMRERYLAEGSENFSDVNLIEMLLYTTIARGDTNPIAHALMERFGSISAILEAPEEELVKVAGVGVKTAELLTLIPGICRAFYQDQRNPRYGVFHDDSMLYDYIVSRFIGYDEEHILLLLINASGRMKYCNVIAKGSFSMVNLDVRQIAVLCVKCHCQRVVLAHNHPSGYTLPSREDILVTRSIRKTLQSFSIELYDHVIVSGVSYESLRESGVLDEPEYR